MTSEIERTTTRNEGPLLKRLSRMYEAGISIRDISEELKMDELTVKRLLKLLGYASAI
jgi:DNA-binding MarR family transcriptional regulator